MNRGASPHHLTLTSPLNTTSSTRLGLSFHNDLHLTRGPLWRRVIRRSDPTHKLPPPTTTTTTNPLQLSPPPPHRLREYQVYLTK
ncbi:hypothetical protein Pcinc_033920 [Petrolisthes cinctipes]|uniref:Uncharacterized protein n=1 Tax=Petrolisthes cinctipes TaxID=88211 RepID=A0AAE1ER88_PETCI|nr:hypothetical protein Pcinc_033920 [Petrolisthes cinctipes]